MSARRIAGLILVLAIASPGKADWPMPGHDPARSSWASQDKVEAVLRPLWCRKIGPYIPSKVQIITVQAAQGAAALVLVSTSRGLYALDPADGNELWRYPTDMPIDQSPAVAGAAVYFGCTDKTVHALQAATGKRIWQTPHAGAAFDTTPWRLTAGSSSAAGTGTSMPSTPRREAWCGTFARRDRSPSRRHTTTAPCTLPTSTTMPTH